MPEMLLCWCVKGVDRRGLPRGRVVALGLFRSQRYARAWLESREGRGEFPALEHGPGRAVLLTEQGAAIWPKQMRNTKEARMSRLNRYPLRQLPRLRSVDELEDGAPTEIDGDPDATAFWNAIATLRRLNGEVALAALAKYEEQQARYRADIERRASE